MGNKKPTRIFDYSNGLETERTDAGKDQVPPLVEQAPANGKPKPDKDTPVTDRGQKGAPTMALQGEAAVDDASGVKSERNEVNHE